nr:hypothetical protein [Nitrosomonas nitrosa]
MGSCFTPMPPSRLASARRAWTILALAPVPFFGPPDGRVLRPFAPVSFSGPPEGRVFRPSHDGGLVAPSGLSNEIGTLCPIASGLTPMADNRPPWSTSTASKPISRHGE